MTIEDLKEIQAANSPAMGKAAKKNAKRKEKKRQANANGSAASTNTAEGDESGEDDEEEEGAKEKQPTQLPTTQLSQLTLDEKNKPISSVSKPSTSATSTSASSTTSTSTSTTTSTTTTTSTRPSLDSDPEVIAKYVKGLKKKLKQIEELKSKIASGAIPVVDSEQSAKLAKQTAFEADVAYFEKGLTSNKWKQKAINIKKKNKKKINFYQWFTVSKHQILSLIEYIA